MFEKTNAEEEEEGQSILLVSIQKNGPPRLGRACFRKEREREREKREKGEKLVATPFRAGAVAVGDLSRSTLFPAFESFFLKFPISFNTSELWGKRTDVVGGVPRRRGSSKRSLSLRLVVDVSCRWEEERKVSRGRTSGEGTERSPSCFGQVEKTPKSIRENAFAILVVRFRPTRWVLDASEETE